MSDSTQDSDVAKQRELLAGLEAGDDRTTPDIARRIASTQSELGDLMGASETLDNALAQHPDNRPLAEQSARLKLRLGDMAGVIVRLSPFEHDLGANLAMALARARAKEEDAQAAAETLVRALERHPGDDGLAARCASYLMTAGDAKGAIAVLTPRLETLQPPSLVVLAQAAADVEAPEKGEAIIVQALTRHPDDPVLIQHLAQMHLTAGRSREAIALLEPSEETSPAEHVTLLSRARLAGGDPMGALATLERAAPRFAANAIFLQGLALARRTAGDAKGALAVLDQVPEPHNLNWFRARAQASETLGDLSAHEAAIRQGLDAFPSDVWLLSQLSKLLTSRGKLDEAHEVGAEIEDALVANPDELGAFVASYFIFGDAHGAAELTARVLSKLESAKPGRRTARALIHLIPGARLLRADIGRPLFERILAQLKIQAVPLSLDQQVTAAVACGIVGDHASLRARVAAMMPKLERVKDIIEAISLSAWTNDQVAIAALEPRFKTAVDNEQRVRFARRKVAANAVRTFSDAELGAAGFSAGGSDVVILFAGLYDVPGEIQQRLVLGPLSHGADVIRMFDMRRDVHLSGIGPGATRREQSFVALKRVVTERGYRRVICVGTSGGGMPAAIYGDAIGADRVVVFSTGTFFPPDDDPLERRARAFLHKVRSTGIEIGSDNLEIWQRPGRHPELHVHYPALNPQDARHALRMQGLAGVTLYPVQSAQHGFFTMLSDSQLSAAILGTPPE